MYYKSITDYETGPIKICKYLYEQLDMHSLHHAFDAHKQTELVYHFQSVTIHDVQARDTVFRATGGTTCEDARS
jgi:hypothetical protein